ncbi:MarR family winged helix-turn-helix transcriptional regulator [Devosia riboflavina]
MSVNNLSPEEIAEQMTLDHMICFAAYSASQAMNRFYRPILQEMGLTYPQFIAMMVLWEDGQTTMKALSDRLMLESNTLTPLLKKLEAAGLVTRARNKDDERLLDIAATEKGMALKRRGCRAPVELAAATGETLEGVVELQQRLANLRNELNAKAD